MNHLSAGVDGVEAWFEGLGESAETLFQADESLADLFIRVGAPATHTGAPCSETSGASSATIEHAFIACCLMLFIVSQVFIWSNWLIHGFKPIFICFILTY